MIRERREALNISQAELARRVGIRQPSLHNIEIGKTKKSRYMPEINRELGIDPMTGRMQSPDSIRFSGSEAHNAVLDTPVYAMHLSPDGENVVLTTKPTHFVVRPALLQAVPDASGIAYWGDDNFPAYRSGDVIFVHPYQPPCVGVDVVARPVDESDMRLFVGELIEHNAREFKVRTYRTQVERTFKRSEWHADWIAGKYNKRPEG